MKAHEALLTGYYRARGYDPDTGVPTPALMARLEIPEVLDRTLREGPYVEWEGPALRPLEAYPHGGTRA